MVPSVMHRAGFRSWFFQGWSLGTVVICIALWIRAKTVDQEERGNAERRALFAGLWAPTLWVIGSSVERQEQARSRWRPSR